MNDMHGRWRLMFVIAGLMVAVSNAPTTWADPVIRDPDIPVAECIGAFVELHVIDKPALTHLQDVTGFGDGFAIDASNSKIETAFFDYRHSYIGNDGTQIHVYLITGKTTQYTCSGSDILCQSLTTVDDVLDWAAHVADQAEDAVLDGVPPLPGCEDIAPT